jgi:hypothetical protein
LSRAIFLIAIRTKKNKYHYNIKEKHPSQFRYGQIMKQSINSVTQKDVARLAGVSVAVVSYVVNNGPRQVSPEMRQKVLDAIDALGYHPNKYAQNLKVNGHQTQRQIGVLGF